MRKAREIFDRINKASEDAKKVTGKLLRMQNALQTTANSFNKNIAEGKDKDVIFAQLAKLQNSLILLSKGEPVVLKSKGDITIDAVSLSNEQKQAAFRVAAKRTEHDRGLCLVKYAEEAVKALKTIEIQGRGEAD